MEFFFVFVDLYQTNTTQPTMPKGFIDISVSDTEDGVLISHKACGMSGVLSMLAADYEGDEGGQLTLPSSLGQNKALLEDAVAYCEHHCLREEDVLYPSSDVLLYEYDIKNIVSEWDNAFISKYSIPEVMDLIALSEYFQIDTLVDLCALYAACTLRESPLEEHCFLYG